MPTASGRHLGLPGQKAHTCGHGLLHGLRVAGIDPACHRAELHVCPRHAEEHCRLLAACRQGRQLPHVFRAPRGHRIRKQADAVLRQRTLLDLQIHPACAGVQKKIQPDMAAQSHLPPDTADPAKGVYETPLQTFMHDLIRAAGVHADPADRATHHFERPRIFPGRVVRTGNDDPAARLRTTQHGS